jgi:hypothetical protein
VRREGVPAGVITVDFVAKGDTDDDWKMVLVEQGPWAGSIDLELRRLQDRLYGCLDAALDGQLAEKFPGSLGKKITIRLDCYNVPRDAVSEFFARFSKGVLQTPEYRNAAESTQFAKGFCFEITFDSIH